MERDNFIVIHQFFGTELQLKGFDKEVFAYIYGITKEDGICTTTTLQFEHILKYFNLYREVHNSLLALIKKGLVIERVSKNIFDKSMCVNYVVNMDKINKIRKQYQSNLQK